MGYDIYTNMNFTVRADGREIPCRSVQGMQRQREQEFIREGGQNDFVHVRPKPVSRAQILKLECLASKSNEDILPLGRILSEPLVVETKPDASSGKLVRFTFGGCMVVDKIYGDLRAEKGGLLEETISVAYQEMKVEYVG